MLAPVLRLLAIYLCVGLAVFGFFKRDVLMGMFQGDQADTSHAAAPAAPAAMASSPAPGATAPEPATHAAAPVQPAATPVFAPLPDPAAPTEVPAAAPAPAPSPAPVQPQPLAQDFETQRNAARQAYWSGDKDGAIAAYQALLAQSPNDGALNGELGNIYYITNQREQAAIHFEKAGQAALAAGNRAEVSMMVGILRGLDPAAAQRLSDARQGAGQ